LLGREDESSLASSLQQNEGLTSANAGHSHDMVSKVQRDKCGYEKEILKDDDNGTLTVLLSWALVTTVLAEDEAF
jgi:hypothetical protein